jgi:sporulation protein YlmC with PRC-barrel domain
MDTSRTETGESNPEQTRRVLSASTLTGDRVRNNAGEDLGTIDEIMIDTATGRVAYAVLSYGGFLGMGDKLFAIPWRAFTLDQENEEFILDVSKQTLESAPGFDKDNWPDMTNPEWETQIHSFYGVTQPSYEENLSRAYGSTRKIEIR